ncbi:hypothetical protein [Eggerthella sp. YY7918]|uniref:hypothetical protein n=1 Tax=Eggerthella sp. (strain YY7918) TaxID=502558 RepID=UPI000217112A|nr:hypothetical protein [Eggerthella sp. YY7918]BAK44104.1 hypothetical protein EGYY_09150 [Eggerthella sp. YY7918]
MNRFYSSVAKAFYNGLTYLPLDPHKKFTLIRSIRRKILSLRGVLEPKVGISLIYSNEGYGHEYWLKQYCGYGGDLYAAIEHGVYFGGNVSDRVNTIYREWEIGSFITYGQYRAKYIKDQYPEHDVYLIGPYIQYVSPDKEYQDFIRGGIDDACKTLTLFPCHSVRNGKAVFDFDSLLGSTKWFARTHGFKNLIVCISPMDYNDKIIKAYQREGFFVVTCGSDPYAFLPRQRAIFEISDVTISNDLGTHVGYSLACQTPHAIMDPVSFQDRIDSGCVAPGVDIGLYQKERVQFFEAFHPKFYQGKITHDQRELFNYYWGGNIRQSTVNMNEIFNQCRKSYYSRITRR